VSGDDSTLATTTKTATVSVGSILVLVVVDKSCGGGLTDWQWLTRFTHSHPLHDPSLTHWQVTWTWSWSFGHSMIHWLEFGPYLTKPYMNRFIREQKEKRAIPVAAYMNRLLWKIRFFGKSIVLRQCYGKIHVDKNWNTATSLDWVYMSRS